MEEETTYKGLGDQKQPVVVIDFLFTSLKEKKICTFFWAFGVLYLMIHLLICFIGNSE